MREVAELEAAESVEKKELEELRQESVPILLPRGDLFDWSEQPSASWAVCSLEAMQPSPSSRNLSQKCQDGHFLEILCCSVFRSLVLSLCFSVPLCL